MPIDCKAGMSKAALEAYKKSKEDNKNGTSVASTALTSSQSGALDEATLLRLSTKAKENVEKMFDDSAHFMFAKERLSLFPKLDYDELELGSVLGRGQFGVVSEIKSVRLARRASDSDEVEKAENEENQDRAFIANHCTRNESKEARYAVKLLNQEHLSDASDFFTGVRDMAIEAHFLGAMEHPNIIKLRGLSLEPLGGKQFFLIFDRLYGTLNTKLAEWKITKHKLSRGLIANKNSKEKKRAFLETRMSAALDLSAAIMYLHQNFIIDRDLKPDNVGFDIRGDVKLFDFGLSKEFDPNKERPYKFTGQTGSMLYMAPEVHYGMPYVENIDIYSLGLIVWEMLSLDKLFPNFSASMLKESVMNRGIRPGMDKKWDNELQSLLKNMWHADPEYRPTARQVNVILKRQLNNIKPGEQKSERSLMRRRSTFVQRRFTSRKNVLSAK